MANDENITLPDGTDLALCRAGGVILIVGEPNTGKSTLARHLFRQFQEKGTVTAYLDGDPGQSTIGPPATMTVATGRPGEATFPPAGKELSWFVGAVSPRRHMLPMLSGAARLSQAALEGKADLLLYDSSGLVDPQQGGAALKRALVDVLQPATIVAIQRRKELQELLRGWRHSGLRLNEMAPSPDVKQRNATDRQAYRARRFRRYFQSAHRLALPQQHFAMLPSPRWRRNQVAALRDREGFTLALGIVLGEEDQGTLIVRTPLSDPAPVAILEMGDLLLDPETFRDEGL